MEFRVYYFGSLYRRVNVKYDYFVGKLCSSFFIFFYKSNVLFHLFLPEPRRNLGRPVRHQNLSTRTRRNFSCTIKSRIFLGLDRNHQNNVDQKLPAEAHSRRTFTLSLRCKMHGIVRKPFESTEVAK